MKILIYALNFAPELVGCGKYNSELALELAKRGHELRVITALPYYPEWKVYKGFNSSKYSKERWNGIKVIRCPLYVPAKPTGTKRLLHLASFGLSSILALLTTISWKPDIIFNVAPTLFTASSTILFSKLAKAKAWLHVQDFEIDAAFNLGLLNNKVLSRIALFCEKSLFQCFDKVSTISENMLAKLLEKGVAKTDAFLVPNWVDANMIFPLNEKSSLRQNLGFKNSDLVVLYSGNLGEKQGIEIIINAAKKLQEHRRIQFLICGDGPAKEKLINLSNGLANVHFIEFQPIESLNDLLNSADIHILPQKANAADLVMPSKLTGMLASGKVIIATANEGTQIHRVLKDCGIRIEPENANRLCKAILMLSRDRKKRIRLGLKARKYAETNLSIKNIIDNLEEELILLVKQK